MNNEIKEPKKPQEINVKGEFWLPDSPSEKVSGRLTWAPNSPACLELNGRLIDEKGSRIKRNEHFISIDVSGNPDDIVADNVPRLILGESPLGMITCIDAQLNQNINSNDISEMFHALMCQNFSIGSLILGAHLAGGNYSKINQITIGFDDLLEISDGNNVSRNRKGCLKITTTEDSRSIFNYTPSKEITLRESIQIINSALDFLQLYTNKPIYPTRIEMLTQDNNSQFCIKNMMVQATSGKPFSRSNFLPMKNLKIAQINRWIERSYIMDGLASAVIHFPTDTPIQVQALLSCTLIEGIHKRIVNNCTDITFKQRATDVLDTVSNTVPNIVDTLNEWPRNVTKIRNDLAHHNKINSSEESFLKYIIAKESTQWILKTFLLIDVGIQKELLNEKIQNLSRFKFYHANQKQILRELELLKT